MQKQNANRHKEGTEMTKESTKLLKVIQSLHTSKNYFWENGMSKEHKAILKIRSQLIKKYEALP